MINNKTNCIIIHGCPAGPEELINPNETSYFKHWIPWARDTLINKNIPTITPLLPEPWQPDYAKFKAEFEKYPVDSNSILIGHSCGCAFLVRWLGDSKQRIKKLILVAPWKITQKKDPFRDSFYSFTIDSTIKDRVDEIIVFTSDNEHPDGKKSLEIFNQALGGKVITLPGHGHYLVEQMGTYEFPELISVIA